MKRISLLLISLSLLLIPVAAFAQTGGGSSEITGGSALVTPPTSAPTASPGVGGSAQVTNPLGSGITSFCGLIKAILSATIAIGIPIAVLFIVFAGFKFVLAQGNAAELAKARQNMMYTFIGIGIFLGAWLLAQVIANTVNTLTTGNSSGTGGAAISCN